LAVYFEVDPLNFNALQGFTREAPLIEPRGETTFGAQAEQGDLLIAAESNPIIESGISELKK
jgi:hypothetical protein